MFNIKGRIDALSYLPARSVDIPDPLKSEADMSPANKLWGVTKHRVSCMVSIRCVWKV
jgi:hypothetical protein